MPPDETDRRSDLERLVAILRRRAGLILLSLVIATGAAVGFSLLQQKQYSATASLLFRDPGFARDLFGSTASLPSTDPARAAATNVKLVGLDIIAERAAREFGGLTADEVANMVSVSPPGQSDVVSVTAEGPRPAQAKLVANEFARQFIAFRADADRSKMLQAKRLAESEFDRLSTTEQAGVRGQTLSRAAEKLGVLASLQTGNAELVQPADIPTSPTSPKPVRNGILGGILGLLLGIGLALLLERLNRKMRTPEEARDAFGLPVLGTVPESKALATPGEGEAPELPFMENEAFRTLRASLRYFSIDREVRSVLLSSHTAEAGKSTISWHLARVAAASSAAVIVEADLRAPSLAAEHGLRGGPGLAELLTRQVGLDEAIQSHPVAGGGNGADGGERKLDAIVAGATPPNPAALLESQTMKEVLSQLAERYELVVVDTAPLGVVSDAFPLLREVDGVIAVARIGSSTRDSAERLREQLDRLEAPVLGIVANCVKLGRRRKYGYGYYGYGPQAEQPAGTSAGAGGRG